MATNVTNTQLDLTSAVRYVATSLERAASAALSVEDLAVGYTPWYGDINRIMQDYNVNDGEARRVLIRRVVAALGPEQAELSGDQVRLLKPFDELRYRGSPITPSDVDYTTELSELADALDPGTKRPNLVLAPLTKAVTVGGRKLYITKRAGDLSPLVDSLRRRGWVLELGKAIVDERGVVIVGNRRLAACVQLEAEDTPVDISEAIFSMTFGRGGDADVKRVRLALDAQGRSFSEGEWKQIATFLKADGWTIDAIHAALDGLISRSVIGRAVEGVQLSQPGIAEHKGRGHPTLTDDQRAEVVRRVAAGETQTVLAVEFKVSKATVSDIIKKAKKAEEDAREEEYRAFLWGLLDQGYSRDRDVLAARMQERFPSFTGGTHSLQLRIAGYDAAMADRARRDAPAEMRVSTPDPTSTPTPVETCTCPACGHAHNREPT